MTRHLDDLDSLDRLALGDEHGAVRPVVFLPMQRCAECDGDRPHITTDHYSTCLACGRTVL